MRRLGPEFAPASNRNAKLRLVWLDKAEADYDRIIDYISDRNPAGAAKIEQLIESAVERILRFPRLYRPGRVAGTREAVIHPNYIIVYREEPEQIVIVAVLHTRQQYP